MKMDESGSQLDSLTSQGINAHTTIFSKIMYFYITWVFGVAHK